MNIIVETASALKYLHASNIIHRDTKTTDILFDANFHVKLANFGISCILPTNESYLMTKPKGTHGYMDPNFKDHHELTKK